jgi:hypothetical protein
MPISKAADRFTRRRGSILFFIALKISELKKGKEPGYEKCLKITIDNRQLKSTGRKDGLPK